MHEKLVLDDADEAAALRSPRKKSTFAELAEVVSDDESDDDEEFFDAVGAGDVEVVTDLMPKSPPLEAADGTSETGDLRAKKMKLIEPSFHGYEDPVRKKLSMDADDRPKISLWVSFVHQVVEGVADVFPGHPEINDREGHDEDDSACVIQRTDFASAACGGRYGVH
jgi:hypothetical protein